MIAVPLFLAAFLLFACGQREGEPAPPLTLSQLKNTGYHSEWSDQDEITLVDGLYQEEIVPGAASKLTITIVPGAYSFGDLDGDGVEDAVVVLATSGGGSGTFISLEAVLNDGGVPRHAAGLELGDRVTIRSVGILSGVITVEILTHRPADPMAVPTLESKQRYRLEAGELEAVR